MCLCLFSSLFLPNMCNLLFDFELECCLFISLLQLSRDNYRITTHRSLFGAIYDTSKETLHVATFDHASHVCVLIFNFKAPVLRDIPAFEVDWNLPEVWPLLL